MSFWPSELMSAIQDRMLGAGIPCQLSGTAGAFLCNALMYHALGAAAERQPAPLCGFIHIPYLPEQVADVICGCIMGARDFENGETILVPSP